MGVSEVQSTYSVDVFFAPARTFDLSGEELFIELGHSFRVKLEHTVFLHAS